MRQRVEAHVDGELAVDDLAAVADHLAVCLECRGDADIVRCIKESLRRVAGRQPTELAVTRLRHWARAQLR